MSPAGTDQACIVFPPSLPVLHPSKSAAQGQMFPGECWPALGPHLPPTQSQLGARLKVLPGTGVCPWPHTGASGRISLCLNPAGSLEHVGIPSSNLVLRARSWDPPGSLLLLPEGPGGLHHLVGGNAGDVDRNGDDGPGEPVLLQGAPDHVPAGREG